MKLHSPKSPKGKKKLFPWKRSKSKKRPSTGGDSVGGQDGGVDSTVESTAVATPAKEEVEHQVDRVVANVVDVLGATAVQQPPPTPSDEKSGTPSADSQKSHSNSIKSKLRKLVQQASNKEKSNEAAAPAAKEEAAPKSTDTNQEDENEASVALKPSSSSSNSILGKDSKSTSNSLNQYVPLQQRLKERQEFEKAKNQSKKKGIGCSSPKNCNAMNEDGLNVITNFLPEFDEICSPIEVEFGCVDLDLVGDMQSDAHKVAIRDTKARGISKTKEGDDDTVDKSLWSAQAPTWFLNDLMRAPIQKLDDLLSSSAALCLPSKNHNQKCDELISSSAAACFPHDDEDDEEATLQSDDPMTIDEAMMSLESADSNIFAKMAPAATFPPAVSETKAMDAQGAETLVVELAKARAAGEAMRARERALEEARALAVEEAQLARENEERQVNAYTEELKWMLDNLRTEAAQNSALNEQVARLKQDIINATKQQSLDQTKARAVEEAQRAKEQTIASLEEELETKRNLVSSTEKAIEETRADLSDVQKQYNQEKKAVQTLQEELKGTKTKLAEVEGSSQEHKKEEVADSAKQIQTLQSQASIVEEKLKGANENANKSEQKLKLYEATVESMTDNLMQSWTDVEGQESELATRKDEFMAQTQELNTLEARCMSESEKNTVLSDRVRELNKKIFAATSQQETVDERAQQDKERTEMKIKAQTDALKKLEASLESESQQNSALKSQIAMLKNDISNTQDEAQKTIDAQDDGLKKMALNLARMREGTKPSFRGKTQRERALQKKIDLLSQEFAVAQKKYAEKMNVVESMSVDDDMADGSTMASTVYTKEEVPAVSTNSANASKNIGWFQRLVLSAAGDDESLSTYDTRTTYEASVISKNVRGGKKGRSWVRPRSKNRSPRSGRSTATKLATLDSSAGRSTVISKNNMEDVSLITENTPYEASVEKNTRGGKKAGSRLRSRSEKLMSDSDRPTPITLATLASLISEKTPTTDKASVIFGGGKKDSPTPITLVTSDSSSGKSPVNSKNVMEDSESVANTFDSTKDGLQKTASSSSETDYSSSSSEDGTEKKSSKTSNNGSSGKAKGSKSTSTLDSANEDGLQKATPSSSATDGAGGDSMMSGIWNWFGATAEPEPDQGAILIQ